MGEQIDRSLVTERGGFDAVGAFGLIAPLLATVGLYGEMAYTVARKMHETGVRAMWMVMREVLVLIGIGAGIGVVGAVLLTQAHPRRRCWQPLRRWPDICPRCALAGRADSRAAVRATFSSRRSTRATAR